MIHLYFNIEDFDNMDSEDLKDELHPIIHMIGIPSISVGIKIYGTDDNGEVLKESMVLL
jgi:sortase (surface protein transpeptidase)